MLRSAALGLFLLAASTPAQVHLLDISAFSNDQIDAAANGPEVDGWVEFGDVLVLHGDLPGVPVAGVEAEHLFLVRDGTVPEGATVVAGIGRRALVVAGPDAGLEPIPWNTAVVQRADRAFPAEAAAAIDPLTGAAVAAFDLDLYTDVVSDLAGFETRYTPTSSFPSVTSYVQAELTALGFAVTLDPFQLSGKTRHNVIAEIAGDVTPEDVYIVCGHYDCTSNNPSVNAPGADDNASGAAAVIEMARVLRNYRFDSTIRFIAFAGEEQGLVGSSAYVNDLVAAGQIDNLKGVINMDMIAYLNTGVWDVLLEGKAGVSSALLALLSGLVPQYTALTAFVSTNPYGSDHMPFINKGVNAVLTIEYEDWFNPNYHKTSDTVATLTLPFAGEIVKLNIAATAIQAGIKGGYMAEFGAGLAGSGGFTPICKGTGSANLGDALTVSVEDGLGGTTGLMILGTASAGIPKFGGMLLVSPFAIYVSPSLSGPAGAPGAGTLQLGGTVPVVPSLTGQSLFVQFALWDAGAVQGVSFTNGLELLFGI